MKKRIVAFLLSAAMVFTNIMPAMADTTVINLEGMITEQSREEELQPDQDVVSDNDLSTDTAVDQQAEDMSDYSLNIPKNGTISSGSSYGYAENGINFSLENDIDADCAVTYPAKYDPRPAGVSDIRCQFLGSCWAYSALAAAESNLIKKGYADSSIDLSEFQLIYFMNHVNIDPLGNYTLDTKDTTLTNTELFDEGGSPKAAVSFLSKWTGPVLESQAPVIDLCTIPSSEYDAYYEKLNNTTLGQDLCANSSNWHFKGAKYCDYDIEHLDNIKELIYTYGGVTASYYASASNAYYKYFNDGDDASYYFPYKAAQNHAVELIGWDDNYPASNFVEKPKGNGAWLMKNSWGTNMYDYKGTRGSGYFWISYYDKNFSDIIALEYDSKDTYANMYAYDGGMIGLAGSSSMTSYLNIYEARAYGSGAAEKIDGVMTYLTANMPYTLTIYINPVVENGKLVSYSGKSKPVAGCSDYEGFYTINLKSQNIYVPEGMTYGICVETDHNTTIGSTVGLGGIYQEAGQSYYGVGMDSLTDFTVSPYSGDAPCLRGLTNKAVGIVLSESISLDKYSIALKEGKTDKITVDEVLPENTTNKTCSFSSTDETVATVDETGKVTAVGYGECDIVVQSYDGMSSDSCHVSVYCTGFSLADQSLLVNRVCTLEPAFKNGYKGITSEQLTWESSDPDTATVDSMGRVTAHATGTVTITASIKDPVFTSNRLVKASCKVTIGRMAESIKTDADTVTLYEGETHQITAEVLPDDTTDKGLTYSCIRESIAKVSATGLITAVSEGTTTVTLTAMDGSGITKDITVTVLPAIKSMKTSYKSITTKEGNTFTIDFDVSPRVADWTNRISITSSDSSVADACIAKKTNNLANIDIQAKHEGECDIIIASIDANHVSLTVHVTVEDSESMQEPEKPSGNPKAEQKPAAMPSAKPSQTPEEDTVSITVGNMYFETEGSEAVYTTALKNTSNVTIPEYVYKNGKSYKVTKIADKAFYKNTKLKTVTIPSTVTEIGSKAFYGCSKLTKITIPKNVQKIGSKAFYGCKKLQKVTIKSTKLKKVGSKAFAGISKKAVIKVPKKKLTAFTKLLKGKYTKGVKIKK